MPEAQRTAADYTPEDLNQVLCVVLTIATVLGDEIMQKHAVLVGGLVPSLLIPPDKLPPGVEPHVGTSDADVSFSLAILDDQLYHTISELLRGSDFEPDVNPAGNPTPHRWRHKKLKKIVVDFLMPQVHGENTFSKWLEKDFAPIMGKAVHLAFNPAPIFVEIDAVTMNGEKAKRTVRVCSAGAFVVLKAVAHRGREKAKDAYDLWYMAANFGRGPVDAAASFKLLQHDPVAKEALEILRADFGEVDQTGPARVARFLGRAEDAALRADVVKAIDQFLSELEQA